MKILIFITAFILSLIAAKIGTVFSQPAELQNIPSENFFEETIDEKSTSRQNQENPSLNKSNSKQIIINLDNLKVSDDLNEEKEDKLNKKKSDSNKGMDTSPKKTDGITIFEKSKVKIKTRPRLIESPKIDNPTDNLMDKTEIESGFEFGF